MMRLLFAFLAGIALPLSMNLVDRRILLAAAQGPMSTMAFWSIVNFFTHLAIGIVALGALSWPLRSWRRMIRVTLAGALGVAGTTLMNYRAGLGGFVAALTIVWILTSLPLFLAVRLRARWSPIHPPGHCRHCGYNLTGNVSGVCPECGAETKR